MKTLTGIVTGAKMDKTATVEVTRQWMHPKYKKTVKRTKKYLVHNDMKAVPGSTVIIAETRPMSKRKHFRITKVLAVQTLEKVSE